MTKRIPLSLVGDAAVLAGYPPETPLATALATAGCLLTEPLRADWAELPVRSFQPRWIDADAVGPETPLYRPGSQAAAQPTAAPQDGERPRPAELDDKQATQLAYEEHVSEIAALLRADLSVLVICEKIIVRHLAEHIVRRANREPRIVQVPVTGDDEESQGTPAMLPFLGQPATLRQREIALLRDEMRALKDGLVIVIPHLDLLAGGADESLAPETREVTELLYGKTDAVILAFADTSLTVPEVLAARFSRRLSIEGTPRVLTPPDGADPVPVEHALITAAEADRFAGLDGADFYKHVAGLNPVRLRQAMRYAMQVHEGRPQPSADDLRDTIRSFKAHLATGFEIPRVSFGQIGGYEDVKAELREALQLLSAAQHLPDEDRHLSGEIVPRGFIFHGPPGTGKTLFAKAVASDLSGTIQVVSGPEVTSKWVGEGERKVRELFAEARRNAPSVIVFDEFDSIASRRSNWEDGGSRAANAMVAQILTEMDGFRPDVPMIVIGTTNRLDIIDPALLRPSRFRSFHIGLPNTKARRQIIDVHAGRYRIAITAPLADAIAERTDGWNGDEIRSLFHSAYIAKWLRREPLDDEGDLGERLGLLVGEIMRSKGGRQMSKSGH